ncbi:hypothetical protein F5B22DRAFT_110645 [Xylaria bambusicola]|uniref:uncharacterized protein n=1 Tax=Xylaria bambusicola TaxID=326684 RepID=UPI002007F674|nr:uncharacterized protein F5B22DRAFT_110645 [Xylaria bambusicola]KAI0517588.1 hypothetical protein F5B22DRAFT_110645 [Xylaria bambusicola]
MADEIPTVQILDKKNYFSQSLISLPNALPYPPLPPSSLRLRTSVLSLTVNNFTYAALGNLLHWWDVHRLPSSTPAPYNDSSKYGRISAWGYTQVLDSTIAAIPKGSYLWGYVPLGTLPEDLQVEMHPTIADQVLVTSEHRKHVMPIYNRYFVYAPPGTTSPRADEIARKTTGVAHDAALRVMHATAFLMESFVFSADASRVVAPGIGPDDAESSPWSADDADLSDSSVLIFAPGSKAACLFAALLRARPSGKDRPRRIVGVTSASSQAFVAGTGLYDSVVLTSAEPLTVFGNAAEKRVVVFDFGGRAGVAQRWATVLTASYPSLQFIGVGSAILDPKVAESVFAAAAKGPAPAYKVARVNAGDMRRRAIKAIGEEAYWAQEARSWEGFRRDGIKGLKMSWGEGMGDVVRGWDRLARGEVLPSEGLVYKL